MLSYSSCLHLFTSSKLNSLTNIKQFQWVIKKNLPTSMVFSISCLTCYSFVWLHSSTSSCSFSSQINWQILHSSRSWCSLECSTWTTRRPMQSLSIMQSVSITRLSNNFYPSACLLFLLFLLLLLLLLVPVSFPLNSKHSCFSNHCFLRLFALLLSVLWALGLEHVSRLIVNVLVVIHHHHLNQKEHVFGSGISLAGCKQAC